MTAAIIFTFNRTTLELKLRNRFQIVFAEQRLLIELLWN